MLYNIKKEIGQYNSRLTITLAKQKSATVVNPLEIENKIRDTNRMIVGGGTLDGVGHTSRTSGGIKDRGCLLLYRTRSAITVRDRENSLDVQRFEGW